MNKRIRELADQAELTIRTSTGTYMSHPEFNKKFAELIIRECMLLCQECVDDGCVEAEEPLSKIKQHFGVE